MSARVVSVNAALPRVLEEKPRLVSAIDKIPRQGPVTVGCYSTLAPILVPPLLDEFAAQNPRVELTCVDGPVPELLPRLTSGELDMLVAFETSLPADLERRRLYDSTPVVLLPRGIRWRRGRRWSSVLWPNMDWCCWTCRPTGRTP